MSRQPCSPREPRTDVRIGLATLLVGLLACPRPTAASEGPPQEPDPASLIPSLERSAHVALVPGGISVEVDKKAMMVFPFPGATHLTFDVETDGIFLLSWFTADQSGKARLFGPPWRYTTLRTGERRSLDLDLLEMPDWFAQATPGIRLKGTGKVRISRIGWTGFAGSAAEAEKAHEASMRFAPDAVGYSTINGLARPIWSLGRPTLVPEILGVAGCILFAALWAVLRMRRRGRAAALAATVSVLAIAIAYDVYAMHRLLPALCLRLETDAERRIRDNYYFAPEIGALSSLARARLGPKEKVGIQAEATDWFGPQTLCFNLAPRPCVLLDSARSGGSGISGVRHLAVGDLDAVVVYDAADALIPGFAPVAQLNQNAFVARRIP